MRSRGESVRGSSEGFPEILVRPQQVVLPGGGRCGLFVEAFVEGGTLADLAREGMRWSEEETARLAVDVIARLEVMHTAEHSLGLVHSDIKPANVLYDSRRNTFVLFDLDCATAIPSVAPKKKKVGLKQVQGSYQFGGIDMLLGESPSPKTDLCSLGQLLLFCLAGHPLWEKKSLSDLAKEKERWRDSGPPSTRPYLRGLRHDAFAEYFVAVERLESVVERPDYRQLASLFAAFASPTFGPPSLRADPRPAPAAPQQIGKENSPKVARKKAAAPIKKKKVTASSVASRTSPTRPPPTKDAIKSSPTGPNLRPRRAAAAGTKKYV